MALSPNGDYAVIANAGSPLADLPARDGLTSGSSLTVVNVQRMRIASVYQDSSPAFFMGVAAARDPANPGRTIVLASDAATGCVRVFDLDADGRLTPQTSIALPGEADSLALPAQIAVAPGNQTAYVADDRGNAVVVLDLATRSVLRSLPTGDSPLYVAADASALVASDSGLSTYAPLDEPAAEPRFEAPAFEPGKSSALSVFAFAPSGAVADPATVAMDPAPDGTRIIGGAAPGAAVLNRAGQLAYVALANVDRVAVVSLAGHPRVVRGLDLRLYPGAPYGAQPSAEALSPDGKRLFVALAGLDAVAVLDARRAVRYRFGLIPTAWYPTAVALSSNGRYLYVTDAKGVDGWGVLQRVDLKHTSLVKATLAALRYTRTPHVARWNPVIPPLRSNKRSSVIDHVVYIASGTLGYDAMLGDLKDADGAAHGNGNPALSRYPESETPNLHALARTYALADNFYAADADLDVSRVCGLGAEATLFQQLTDAVAEGRGADPEDYGREGFLFNAFARAGLTFRDYGGLLRLSGFDGSFYHRGVPALAALAGNVDLDYAGENDRVSDMARADEFARDMQEYVQADRMPSFSYVWLPVERGAGSVAAADRALGSIVDYLSHTPHWSSTAVFIVPSGVRAPADHVNPLRSYAIVVSPLARRGFVGDEHLSVASVVKTEEEIFGLPPLALNDLLASDMASFFTDAPNPQPYRAQ